VVESADLNKSSSKMTPRKKIVKLVSNVAPPGHGVGNGVGLAIGSHSTKNKKKTTAAGTLDPSQANLINNYYHSL